MSDPFDPPAPGSVPATSHCYRHPDRETYIRCTRCERLICPECMRPASVGFQCAECVEAGSRGMRQARTLLGGRPTSSTRVTTTLISLAVIAFLGQLVLGIWASATQFGLVPTAIAVRGEWWRLLSPVLLHGSLLHIFFNMYVLLVIGQQLERVLGHARFLALYLVSALGGSAASYAFSPLDTVSVGASGAVFGLMAATVVTGRRLRYDVSQVVVLIGINTVIGFVVPGIDWRAHLGGLVTGALVALAYARAPRRARSLWQWTGVAAVVLVVLSVVAWRTTVVLGLLG